MHNIIYFFIGIFIPLILICGLNLIRPSYWLQLYSYSAAWDKMLNELLDKHKFTKIDNYTAYLGNIKIWIANHPYCSFRPYDIEIRAKRSTIYRAHKKLLKDLLSTKET